MDVPHCFTHYIFFQFGHPHPVGLGRWVSEVIGR